MRRHSTIPPFQPLKQKSERHTTIFLTTPFAILTTNSTTILKNRSKGIFFEHSNLRPVSSLKIEEIHLLTSLVDFGGPQRPPPRNQRRKKQYTDIIH